MRLDSTIFSGKALGIYSGGVNAAFWRREAAGCMAKWRIKDVFHARVLEEVAKSQSPLKAVIFKSGLLPPEAV